jgi:hypothetical protein
LICHINALPLSRERPARTFDQLGRLAPLDGCSGKLDRM